MSKKTEPTEAEVTTDSTVENVPAKDELEKVNLVNQAEGERAAPAPKLVNYDNGTQSFQDSEIQKVTHPEIVQGAYAMDNADVTKLVYVDNVETPVVARETRVIDQRLKKADFQRVMDDMQKTNPAKFEQQKADLQKQMDAAPE